MSKELDETLVANLHSQLNRLVEQLADLEAERDALDEEEYTELKEDTIAQLKELNLSLSKLQEGNITLLDELSAAKFAIQAAISAAFKTPEVVALFVKKQPAALREKLVALDTELHLSKIHQKEYEIRKRELLMALQKLHDPLSQKELQFLQNTDQPNEFTFELAEAPVKRTCTNSLLNDLKK